MMIMLGQEGGLTIPSELRMGLVENTLFEGIRREDGVIELQRSRRS